MRALIVVVVLLLSGCVGSAILISDADYTQSFPDLHSVPEVVPEEISRLNNEEVDPNPVDPEQIKHRMSENAKLRTEHGLSVKPEE